MKEIAQLLRKHEAEVLNQWLAELSTSTRRGDLISGQELKSQADQLLKSITVGVQDGSNFDPRSSNWKPATELLDEVSRSRASQGFSPTETAMFVFALKKTLFALIRNEHGSDAK